MEKIKQFTSNGCEYIAVEVPNDAFDFDIDLDVLSYEIEKVNYNKLVEVFLPPNNKYSVVGLVKDLMELEIKSHNKESALAAVTVFDATNPSQNILILKIEQ